MGQYWRNDYIYKVKSMISDFNLGDLYKHKFKITDEIVDKFIDLSNDKNPLHVDDQFAINKGFKSKVIQGNLQNCFISYFIGECLPCKNVMILSQTIKYKNPLYLNETIFLNVKICGVFDSVGLIEFDFNFKNEFDKIISNGKIKIKLI